MEAVPAGPMPEAHRITTVHSLSDPRVADYANLRDRQLQALGREAPADGRSGRGVFMAEGELVVRQLFRSGLKVRSVLLTPQRLATLADAIGPLDPSIPVYLVDQGLMNTVVGFNIHRGVLAAGERPAPVPAADLAAQARHLVLLETLANHDNVGGIFRAAAGLCGLPGAHPWHAAGAREQRERAGPTGVGVLLSPQSCDPLYRKAIRVSVGAALLLPFGTLDPWPAALGDLKSAGFTLVALTPTSDAAPLEDLHPVPGRRTALLLGSEGAGLTQEALAAADLRVRIPMHGEVDSLNVVVAAGIAMHALCRPGE